MKKEQIACHNCHGNMTLHHKEKKQYTINGKDIQIDGLNIFRCDTCGEEMMSADDAKKVMQQLSTSI